MNTIFSILLHVVILGSVITSSCAQSEIAIEAPGSDYVYRNIENQLKIVVENKACSDLLFNVTHASYKWSGCTLVIQPHDAALTCTIEVMDQSGMTLATRSLFIKDFPDPIPQIANRGPLDYAIDAASIKESQGLVLLYPELRNYKNFKEWSILSFNFEVRYSSGIVVSYTNVGNQFNDKSLEAIKNTTAGSYVVINKILCIDDSGEEQFLPDINLLVE